MKLRNLLLFSFLIFYTTAVVSQSLILPREIGDSRTGKTVMEQMSFFAYPFHGEAVDLRDFKKRYPELKAPDFVRIQAPNIEDVNKLTVLIGLIQGVEPNQNAVVIWLAANYDSNEVIFFLDKKLNRDFSKNIDILELSSSDPAKKIIIQPAEGNISAQELSLKVPPKFDYIIKEREPKRKIIDKFALGFQAGVGFGSMTYQFDNLEKGFPTWYSVNFSKKNIGLTFSYNIRRLRFSLSSVYQNNYYYTSYLNIRFDNPGIITNPSTGKSTVVDNVQVERNLDRHPIHHLQYAATVGLRLHFFRSIEIQPLISMGQTTYLQNYTANQYDDTSEFKSTPDNFVEMGCRFEMVIGEYRAIFVDVLYNRSEWQPKGLFETTPHENLDVTNETWKIMIGYRFGL